MPADSITPTPAGKRELSAGRSWLQRRLRIGGTGRIANPRHGRLAAGVTWRNQPDPGLDVVAQIVDLP